MSAVSDYEKLMTDPRQEPYPHSGHTHCQECGEPVSEHDELCRYAEYVPERGIGDLDENEIEALQRAYLEVSADRDAMRQRLKERANDVDLAAMKEEKLVFTG